MSDFFEFSLEDSKDVVQKQGPDKFKQDRSGQVDRVSIISFRKYHDTALSQATKEKGEPLSDKEKAEICGKVDAKLASKLDKKVEDLTEVDRLNIRDPRFAGGFTHYKDGVGNVKCLSKYNGTTLVQPEVCCTRIGDASQAFGTAILHYPTDNSGDVDMELLAKPKYRKIELWKLNVQKYTKIMGVYTDARKNGMENVDLKVTLDGDPKFQKQVIESAMKATWLMDDIDPEVRRLILEQGLKAWKGIKSVISFEMSKEKLLEKLNGGTSPNDYSGSAKAEPAQMKSDYKNLLE